MIDILKKNIKNLLTHLIDKKKLNSFFKIFVQPIRNNKYVILLIRKPINTWILSNFPYKKNAIKESKIWSDQSYYKIDFYRDTKGKITSEFIFYILNQTNVNDMILDICCNQGRFLKALHQDGYRKLSGVDIMKDAIIDLQNSEEYKAGGIYAENNLFQNYILNMRNESIDYAITFTATIELMHPGFNIFKELNRVIRKGFIFVLDENGHTFPRFYRYQIKSNKFKLKYIKKLGTDYTLIHAVKSS